MKAKTLLSVSRPKREKTSTIGLLSAFLLWSSGTAWGPGLKDLGERTKSKEGRKGKGEEREGKGNRGKEGGRKRNQYTLAGFQLS